MTKKQRQYYTWAAIVVVVIAIVWFAKGKPNNSSQSSPDQQSGQQSVQHSSNNAASSTAGVWTGKLELSDNLAKGNLMLMTSSGNIYIHTARDFSSLIGKQVNVSYQGSYSSFTLQNITAQ